MSYQAMSWATEQDLPAMQKIVLLMLANRTNHDTGRCDPSHERLAKDCGLTSRAVQIQIKKLEEAGLVTVIHRKIDTVTLPNQYQLNMHSRSGGVNDIHPGGEPYAPGGVNDVRTNQEVKPVSKPIEDIPGWLPRDAWDGFVEHRKAIKLPLTAKAAEIAIKKLEALRDDGNDPVAVIEQTILSGKWSGLFAINQGKADRRSFPRASPPQYQTRQDKAKAWTDQLTGVDREQRNSHLDIIDI